jgi:membrane protease YdiL (CAAX protease family)
MQAVMPKPSSALPKLVLYLLAVMLGGALLAPVLFDLGKAGAEWLGTNSLGETAAGQSLLKSIRNAHFTRYFNRAVLVCAIVFIWPFLRWVKIDRSLLPAWRPFSLGLKQWGVGFVLSSGLLLLLGLVFLQAGAYKLRPEPAWTHFSEAISAALGASLVEEFFFRSLLLGLLLRTMQTRSALFWSTFVFALVHFLKPPANWQIPDTQIDWASGFLVLAQIAKGFGNIQFLLAEFATLFAVGWVLTSVRLRTGSLWASIGLHGGWVFGLKYFSGLTLHQKGWLPWIGMNLKIGLAPLVTVLFTGWLTWFLLQKLTLSRKWSNEVV